MPTLDNNDYDHLDPTSVPYKSTAFRYGGIGGVILVLVSLVIHLTGMIDYQELANGGSNTLSNIINFVVWVGAVIMAIKYHRDKELGGYISFGRAFFVGFLTTLVLGLVTSIWTYVFFSFIEPGILEMMREAALDQMPEDQAEAAEGMMGFFMSPLFLTLSAFIFTAIVGAITSLITAAVMKKERA